MAINILVENAIGEIVLNRPDKMNALNSAMALIATDPPAGLVEGSGFTFFGGALPSDSRGSLTLTSTDPTAHPRLDPRYLTEQADVERLIAAV